MSAENNENSSIENLKDGYEQIKIIYQIQADRLKTSDEKLNMLLVFNAAIIALLTIVVPFSETGAGFILLMCLFSVFVVCVLLTIELTFPYVLIVSQSCDMLHASRLMSNEIHSESKLMFSVLAVPMYERETIISGEHLKELCDDKIIDFKINSPFITDEDKKVIKDGFHYRFHEIYFSDDWKIPDSIIDLKGFFTLNLTTINQIKGQRIGRLNDWSSQQIVNKMSAFLSRVGLPEGVSQEKTIVQNQQ